MQTLYHFTCQHGHAGILKTGTLIPHPHIFAPGAGPILWLTDLAEPSAESVGLTSTLTRCNRLAHRYRVETKAAKPWALLRPRFPANIVADMESFGQPDHWYVVQRPVLASEFTYDATWALAPAYPGRTAE